MDGTQWSVSNTPAVVAALPKAASRRFSAAFAKLRLVSVVELGTHAPVAALAAPVSESEQALAQQLWAKIPEHSLVIGDRLFGTPRTLWEALAGWQERDITFLVRVRDNIGSEVQQRLPDGSAVVRISVSEDAGLTHHFQVREIRANGIGRDGKRFKLRLWTTLMDPVRYPADTLARHYAERWEHELYYRELKLDVRNAPVLASHTGRDCLAGDRRAGFGECGHCTIADRGCGASEDSTESAELLQGPAGHADSVEHLRHAGRDAERGPARSRV